MTLTKPGIYDLPVADYHADPIKGGSLSSSGARKLLPPNCPALFFHEQQNPPTPTHEFDVGHAAHKLVLGEGPEIAVIAADDWRSKAAREERDEARAAGQVPLLHGDWVRVSAMADALAAHPIASAVFHKDAGKPEQTLVWQDAETGVWRRALLDWLPNNKAGGRLIVPDYKTARSADPEKFSRSAADYGYHQQAAWYLDGVRALGLDDDPAFVFVVQEKEPPYLVTVVELDVTAMRIGMHLNRRAIDVYAECTRTGIWPGYSDDVALVSLPAYYENRHLEEIAS